MISNASVREVVSHYIEALRLESEVDRLYHEQFGICGTARLIPRAYVASDAIRRLGVPLRLLLPLILVAWCALIQPLWALLQLLRWAGTVRDGACLPPRVYLDASNARNLAFARPTDPAFPQVVVNLPFRKRIGGAGTLPQQVDLRAFTPARLLFAAAWCSCLAGWRILGSSADRSLGLYSYTAFNWLWVRLALARQHPQSIWISNHYDRWTCLTLGLGAEVTLVQHGGLKHALPHGGKVAFARNRKLKGLRKIYTLDDESVDLFGRYIDTGAVDFEKLPLRTELQEWRRAGEGRLKVLIIGNQGELGPHERLLDRLLGDLAAESVDVAYRHHPLQRRRLRAVRARGAGAAVWELTASDPLPVPDLVVSYGSSLDVEIVGSTGAEILRYSWSPELDADELVREIARRSDRPDRPRPHAILRRGA